MRVDAHRDVGDAVRGKPAWHVEAPVQHGADILAERERLQEGQDRLGQHPVVHVTPVT